MVRQFASVRTLCGLALIVSQAFAQLANKTIVMHPDAFAVSGPVSEMPIMETMPQKDVLPVRPSPLSSHHGPPVKVDRALQKRVLPSVNATKGVDFDGVGANGWAPSDDNLAVGPNHILQTVNVQFGVYSKTGALLSGPTNFITFFSALGGSCAAGSSDPIALYDRQADRWVIAEIGIGSSFSECYGVSKTNDPTGSYYLYAFDFGANLNDYDKASVWPTASNSAYLLAFNNFESGVGFAGAGLCGFDRTKALAGDATASLLCQQTPNTEGSYLPSDNDGPTPPADGTPGLFLNWKNSNPGQLYLRRLTLNFASGTATLTGPTIINVANDNLACGNGGVCVPQVQTIQPLDTLGDRLMYRFPVRHFSDHDRAVANHAVGTSGGQVAFRWYELYDPAGNVTLNQQGTFAPDSTYRWMGSIAEDRNADIAIGYSASSSIIHPAIRFTGRLPSDASGMLESENSIVEGTGSQNHGLNRWGDYSGIQVDPTDDCTFWYTNQYQKTNGAFNWSTRIGSFVFPVCLGNPDFTLNANPNAVTVAQSASATSAITVVPLNGFNGSVTLSASGLPSGVTAGFTPNPATSTSTLTLTASGLATTGTSTVTITGTSGSLTSTTTLSLAVTASGPAVTLSPTSLTWGKVVVGVTSGAKTATLTNSGVATLNISNIATSGDFALFSFTSKKKCGSTVLAGASCLIKVTFTPTQKGLRTGALTITDNAASSPQQMPLTGTGK
jgi:hypothetical protein